MIEESSILYMQYKFKLNFEDFVGIRQEKIHFIL